MASYSSTFNEIISAGSFKNDFISFWNQATSTLHNNFMPVEVVLNSTDLAILKPQVASIQDEVLTLQNNVQTINSDINDACTYILELQAFFANFKSSIYIADGNNAEFNYDVLVNGVPNKDLSDIQVYLTSLKSFFNTFKENIYLSDSSGSEMDYSKLL